MRFFISIFGSLTPRNKRDTSIFMFASDSVCFTNGKLTQSASVLRVDLSHIISTSHDTSMHIEGFEVRCDSYVKWENRIDHDPFSN